MRVISGSAGGRRLLQLEGMQTRPTTDKVKESLFNILQFELEGRRVLDLFGGTGQLGIEALSRGASQCTFVEQRRDAVALIRENLNTTGLSDLAHIVQGDAVAFLTGCRERYDVILLDPPYEGELLELAMRAVAQFDILREHGIMMCESVVDRVLPALASPYELGREYRYGKIKLTAYHRAGSGR